MRGLTVFRLADLLAHLVHELQRSKFQLHEQRNVILDDELFVLLIILDDARRTGFSSHIYIIPRV